MAKPQFLSSLHRLDWRLVALTVLPTLAVVALATDDVMVWPRSGGSLIGAFAIFESVALACWLGATWLPSIIPLPRRGWWAQVLDAYTLRVVQVVFQAAASLAWLCAAVVVTEFFARSTVSHVRGQLLIGLSGLLWLAALHTRLLGRTMFPPITQPTSSAS